ncbi:hypothetical protein BN440_2680 [Erwinia amylovora MR1]|nr:hypothetical protein BN440_2680 [Erwinia amylovora MR1]
MIDSINLSKTQRMLGFFVKKTVECIVNHQKVISF